MPPPLAIKADASSTRGRNSFPTPFKCSGDFCGFALKLNQADPVNSHRVGGRRAAAPPPQAAASSALSLLFTKEQLRVLGDANFSRLVAAMEIAQAAGKIIDGKQLENGDLRVITYKSIALAKGNREHLEKVMQASQMQSSGDCLNSPTKAGERKRQSHLLDSTLSQELRENSRSRVYGEMDGVANYYRQVRVCADCYAVYALLDLARQMVVGPIAEDENTHTQQKQQQLKKKQQKMYRQRFLMETKWEERVAQEVLEKEAILLRNLQYKAMSNEAELLATNGGIENSLALPTLAKSKNSTRNNTDLSKSESDKHNQMHDSNRNTVKH
ncbi:Hypothetical protein PHPALM_16699 [Phytophthora palmivora]|uniref:Uncharacterized protein n=1 Tax=Phytophthora palmivora TaxID=4796 RepID=A0A2P4XPA5_9STRA|nr:Hypothetical protein PHPALM_16699 [Phytophthora palmivora]